MSSSSIQQHPKHPQVVIHVDDDDDDDDDDDECDDPIDEDQLTEFKEQLVSLGSFADKVIINTLSMIAEDYAASMPSATKLYQILRQRLLSCKPSEKLPVIYVLDSILKNCKGCYITIVEQDAVTWMPVVYQQLDATQQQKLQKVWRTWNEFQLFHDVTQWNAMGRCFSNTNTPTATTAGTAAAASSSSTQPFAAVAGIARTKDGSLILSTTLRREMQNILDDMQSDIANELEKVSLERLADIDPNLLLNIKQAAQDSATISASTTAMNTTTSNSKQQSLSSSHADSSFLTETRSEAALTRSAEWRDFWKKQQPQESPLQHGADVRAALQQLVTAGTAESDDTTVAAVYTQKDALKMTEYFGTCLAVSQLLSMTLERIETANTTIAAAAAATDKKTRTQTGRAGLAVDRAEFTTEGIKQHNPAAVSLLYEIGLPFQSAADGRRFRTQLQLSNHLDYLFRKNQLEKTIAVTEERGWYVVETVWTREQKEQDLAQQLLQQQQETDNGVDEDDPAARTVPADESRDCCVICGIHFKMFFDNDDGVYKYSNCIEIAVLNDDAAEQESEQQLVHATCWKGLGQPAVLTVDQTLQETMRH